MKRWQRIVRVATVVLALGMLTFAVGKAQGCKTPDDAEETSATPTEPTPVTDEPEAEAPTGPAPAPADTPDVGPVGDGGAAAAQPPPQPDEEMEVLPATKSGPVKVLPEKNPQPQQQAPQSPK